MTVVMNGGKRLFFKDFKENGYGKLNGHFAIISIKHSIFYLLI